MSEIKEKLTPAAKEFLWQVQKEYSEKLMNMAYTIAQSHDVVNPEISRNDILESLKLEKELNFISIKKLSLQEKIKKIVLIVGGTYVLCGTALIGFYKLFYNSDRINFGPIFNTEVIGLVVSVFGVIVLVISCISYSYRPKRKLDLNLSSIIIVYKWQIIENLISKFFMKNEPIIADKSLKNKLNYFFVKFAGEQDLSYNIKKLLNMRNKIIYENYELDETELKLIINLADELIDKLKKINNII